MIFSRAELVLGTPALKKLGESRAILFGVGGVGGWCAEALIRSGLGHLTIVDPDCVAESNINRQLVATTRTIGRPKVEVLRERLLEINPSADITALQERYSREEPGRFGFEGYDYVIDAIDSLSDKISLIETASKSPAKVFSSMGAACKIDPLQVRVAEFWEVSGCPLAAAMRKKMRQSGITTGSEISCVYSAELIPNKWENPGEKGPNGSIITVTATFGLTIASLLIQDVIKNA